MLVDMILVIVGVILLVLIVDKLDRTLFSKHKNFKKDKNND
jgi:hypothetical protein